MNDYLNLETRKKIAEEILAVVRKHNLPVNVDVRQAAMAFTQDVAAAQQRAGM